MAARVVDGIDIGRLLERSDQAFECRRAKRWLRASVVLNLLLAALLGTLVASFSSEPAGAVKSFAPAIFSRK